MATVFHNWRGLIKALNAAFNTTSGHDHDGTNSKAVTVGTVAEGGITADAAGRAMMADGYFDAATVLAKFAADSVDNAQLLDMVKDGAFNADAGTRALFDDGIWTLAKLAQEAKTHATSFYVPALTANTDLTMTAMVVPTGFVLNVVSASITPFGTSAGIDDSNKSTWAITDGTNTLVTKDFDADPAFPASGTNVDLGTISASYDNVAAGAPVKIVVTNGTTAATPNTMVHMVYYLTAAA